MQSSSYSVDRLGVTLTGGHSVFPSGAQAPPRRPRALRRSFKTTVCFQSSPIRPGSSQTGQWGGVGGAGVCIFENSVRDSDRPACPLVWRSSTTPPHSHLNTQTKLNVDALMQITAGNKTNKETIMLLVAALPLP